MLQERAALPSIRTVQAPHCPRPQPNFGPCNPIVFRSTYSNGCAGSHESTVTARPFTRILKLGIGILLVEKSKRDAEEGQKMRMKQGGIVKLDKSPPQIQNQKSQ